MEIVTPSSKMYRHYTVNVDIFECINFREFVKICNFAGIYIRVLDNIASKRHDKNYFLVVHIFADISKTRIARKYVQCENFYVHSTSLLKDL